MSGCSARVPFANVTRIIIIRLATRSSFDKDLDVALYLGVMVDIVGTLLHHSATHTVKTFLLFSESHMIK